MAMQCAEEGRQLASGDEDSDELSDTGLDVLVTELRPMFHELKASLAEQSSTTRVATVRL